MKKMGNKRENWPQIGPPPQKKNAHVSAFRNILNFHLRCLPMKSRLEKLLGH